MTQHGAKSSRILDILDRVLPTRAFEDAGYWPFFGWTLIDGTGAGELGLPVRIRWKVLCLDLVLFGWGVCYVLAAGAVDHAPEYEARP